MNSYQATTLRKLKQTDSGIHVTVEAMPLPGKSDGNGGYVCDLVKEGNRVSATINKDVYNQMQKTDGIYEVTGKWTGENLDVHAAEITTEFSDSKEKTNEEKLHGRIYCPDSSDPYETYQRMKKFRVL